MSDTPNAPRLLVTGFGPFPGFATNPSAILIGELSAQAWSPEGAQTDYLVLPTSWAGAVATLAQRLREAPADGILLTGVSAGAVGFKVEMRAQNQASTTLEDAEGKRRTLARISPLGPAVLRASAPVEPMLDAIRGAGLPAQASSDAGDYLCNFTFYRLLTEQAAERRARPIGFLHLPPVREAPPGEPGLIAFTLADLERGVKAAAGALARTLVFAPREPEVA